MSMHTRIRTFAPRLAAACLPLLLAACAAPTKPLYDWGAYQPYVYKHLKGEDANLVEQIEKLEAQLVETAKAQNSPPPGLHGHLALLYAKAGQPASSRKHLEAERALFPESAAYIDFLLRNADKASAQS